MNSRPDGTGAWATCGLSGPISTGRAGDGQMDDHLAYRVAETAA